MSDGPRLTAPARRGRRGGMSTGHCAGHGMSLTCPHDARRCRGGARSQMRVRCGVGGLSLAGRHEQGYSKSRPGEGRARVTLSGVVGGMPGRRCGPGRGGAALCDGAGWGHLCGEPPPSPAALGQARGDPGTEVSQGTVPTAGRTATCARMRGGGGHAPRCGQRAAT